MKKTIAAIVLLCVLAALAAWNIRHMDILCGTLRRQIEEVREQAAAGRFDTAETTLDAAITRWESAEGYTHIFIRHAEIDAASDAFYELQSAILSHDAEAAEAGCGKLVYHLESMSTMEHVTVRSVF